MHTLSHGRTLLVESQLHTPRTRRGVYKPNALVERPESEDVMMLDAAGDNFEQDAIQCVLKKLLSNEASSLFFHPVAAEEEAYHAEVKSPICLGEIASAYEAGRYATYADFASDVDLLISNSFFYNDEDSIEWIGTCMLQADLSLIRDEMAKKGLALASPAARLALTYVPETQPVDVPVDVAGCGDAAAAGDGDDGGEGGGERDADEGDADDE